MPQCDRTYTPTDNSFLVQAVNKVMKQHVDLAKKYLTSMGAGDHQSNGLLLAVHIHRCFDDYQFSIYVSKSLVYAITMCSLPSLA